MRPHRQDIALPPFPPGLTWIGPEPAAAERLTGKGPLIVHFFEAGELSSVRSLPLVQSWSRRYADAGLSTIGVHSPRSDLARSPDSLRAALARLELDLPVCGDPDYRVWHAYGCKGWPSLFLWGRGGRLRWFHFGLPDLAATEAAIREELLAGRRDDDPERPEAVLPEPVRGPPSGRRELRKPSDEVFPGGSVDRPWTPAPGEPLEVSYAGAGAWAALDGTGEVRIRADGGEVTRTLALNGPGVYELCEHERHGLHEVQLELDGAVRVWALAFSPGPA
jgi:hypothetical protein